MSELIKNVYSNYPFIVKAKARGYYDYHSTQTINDSGDVNVNLTKFEGLSTSFNETDGYPLTISTKAHVLPNWNYINDTENVFMPLWRNYSDIGNLITNYYLINSGCTIDENGICSGFNSSENKVTINKTFPSTMSSMNLTTKAQFTENSSHSTLFGRSSNGDGTIIIRNNSGFKFGYYNDGWIWESSAPGVELNKWYWFKVTWDGTNLTGYMLEDNSYTLDTLPEIASWTQCWQSTKNMFPGNSFDIGYNKNSSGEYCKGSIDLANTKITVNDELFFAYNQQTLIMNNLNGCLYNYSDTGAADTLNMFSVEKEGNDTSIILTKEESPVIDGSVVTFLNTITIPEHKVYNYSEVEFYKPFDVSLIGSDATYDTSTYQFVGSKSSESYLQLNYGLTSSDSLSLILCVKFNDTSSSSAVIGSKPNQGWIGLKDGKLGGYFSSSFSSDFTLEADTFYFIKVEETSSAVNIYVAKSEDGLINGVNFGEPVYTRSYFGFYKSTIALGANIGYSNENLNGTIYLGQSKMSVNDMPVFGDGSIKGKWTVK